MSKDKYPIIFLKSMEAIGGGSRLEAIRRFLFETLSDRDDYVEVDTLTQVVKFSC